MELDPEPPVKSGRPAPAFRLSRSEPKSAAGHAHGPSDSGTRRFSIGSKDRRVQHLRCRPTPEFILAKPPRRRGRTTRTSCAALIPSGIKLRHARRVHSFIPPRAARCVCATSSQAAASTGVSRNRGNSAPGIGARSGRRFAQWSRRACRTHGRRVPARASWGVPLICLEAVSDAVHQSLGGCAALPLHANGAMQPIAGPIVCRRPASGRPKRWIHRASVAPRPKTGAPPAFLRRGAYSLAGVAYSNPFR